MSGGVRRQGAMAEETGLVTGQPTGHDFHAWWSMYDVHKHNDNQKGLWNFQMVTEVIAMTWFTLDAAFGATEVGGFNIFSEKSMMIMQWATASVAGASLLWTFICFLINMCGDSAKPRCPAVAMTVAGWAVVTAAYFTLAVYFQYQLNNRTEGMSRAQQNEWIDLCWGAILVGCATSYQYWVRSLHYVAHAALYWGGNRSVYLRMLF